MPFHRDVHLRLDLRTPASERHWVSICPGDRRDFGPIGNVEVHFEETGEYLGLYLHRTLGDDEVEWVVRSLLDQLCDDPNGSGVDITVGSPILAGLRRWRLNHGQLEVPETVFRGAGEDRLHFRRMDRTPCGSRYFVGWCEAGVTRLPARRRRADDDGDLGELDVTYSTDVISGLLTLNEPLEPEDERRVVIEVAERTFGRAMAKVGGILRVVRAAGPRTTYGWHGDRSREFFETPGLWGSSEPTGA